MVPPTRMRKPSTVRGGPGRGSPRAGLPRVGLRQAPRTPHRRPLRTGPRPLLGAEGLAWLILLVRWVKRTHPSFNLRCLIPGKQKRS